MPKGKEPAEALTPSSVLEIPAPRGLYFVAFNVSGPVGESDQQPIQGNFVLEAELPWNLEAAVKLKDDCMKEAIITAEKVLQEHPEHRVILTSISRLDGHGVIG